MNGWVKAGIIVGVVVTLTAIALKVYANVKLAAEYCYRVSKVQVNRFSNSAIDIVLTVRFLNKSTLEATITGYNLDIFLNDKKLANVKQIQSIKIAKAGVSQFDVPVSIDPRQKFTLAEIATLIANYMTNAGKERIKIRAAGTISVQAYGVKLAKDKEIDLTYTLKELLETDPNAPVCPEKF
jgi:LEA14-like dessication related protein